MWRDFKQISDFKAASKLKITPPSPSNAGEPATEGEDELESDSLASDNSYSDPAPEGEAPEEPKPLGAEPMQPFGIDSSKVHSLRRRLNVGNEIARAFLNAKQQANETCIFELMV